MRLRTVSVEELGLDTGKIVRLAHKQAVLVRSPGQPTLVLRKLVDDDLADELVTRHPAFRASIRKARKNLAEGKGIPLAEVRRQLGV
jgi:hypothetical protein